MTIRIHDEDTKVNRIDETLELDSLEQLDEVRLAHIIEDGDTDRIIDALSVVADQMADVEESTKITDMIELVEHMSLPTFEVSDPEELPHGRDEELADYGTAD